jgi:uncharacterized protein (DUF1697 family)
MAKFIGLLRGINVSGRNRVPMTELRELCAELRWEDVETYIQSGNVVFQARSTPARLETELQRGIERRFGLDIAVLVRAAADWPGYVEGNPFLEACQSEPNHVMLALAKAKPNADAVQRLRERAAGGERIEQVGCARGALPVGWRDRSCRRSCSIGWSARR